MAGSSTRAAAPLATLIALACACGHASNASAPGPVDAAATDAGTADVDASDVQPGPCVITPPAPPDWRLQADGQVLRDGLGRVVFLRGVDAGGRSKFAPYVPFDSASGQFTQALDQYMDRAASWGIDAMRLVFTWAALEPTHGQDNAAWLAQYQQLVDAAWARGIWTVVDFHQDVYSESFCGDGFPSWTIADAGPPEHDCPDWSAEYLDDMAVQQAFDAFWATGSTVMPEYLSAWDVMIGQFKNEPGVVGFEPINEPAPGTQTQTTFESTTLTAFYTQMVAHMRQAAPDALVFIDLPSTDGAFLTTSLQRPTGDGVVFAPHFYPPQVTPAEVLSNLQAWAMVGTSWNVPVFLGEFGQPNATPGIVDYVTACFGALDTLGMSGTQWEYSVSTEEWNDESYEVVAADGGEYPVVQALVRPFARAVAGGTIVQSWDPTTTTFSLSYAPTGGTTEVQLPSRAYPQGSNVSITGGCYDTTTVPGKMLVQPVAGATQVSLTIRPP